MLGLDHKLLFGCDSVHIGANIILQKQSDSNRIAGVIQTSHKDKLSTLVKDHSHTLLMGDLVFRPHVAIGSNHLQGNGIGHIYREGWFIDQWITKGQTNFESDYMKRQIREYKP